MNDSNPPVLYRNDVWSLDDDFGLGAAGDQVARMALEVDPPFTVGVTGEMGLRQDQRHAPRLRDPRRRADPAAVDVQRQRRAGEPWRKLGVTIQGYFADPPGGTKPESHPPNLPLHPLLTS